MIHPIPTRFSVALSLGMLGLAFMNANPEACAQAKTDKNPPAKAGITPPPADVNDLSMEVAALRTLYLLKTGPDQVVDRPGSLAGIKYMAKDCAQKSRQRQEAKVSKNYLKVLTDLRAAFIANNEDRINELSDQLEELAKDEQPDLDDAVEITEQSRKNAPATLKNYYDASRIAQYIAAYGKDFPDPYGLIYKTVRLDGRGTRPTPEQWKETRAFLIQEVSWQIGGLDLAQQQKIGEQVAKILDKAYSLSNEDLKKEMSKPGVGLRGEIGKLCSQVGPTDVIKHVLEQDLAELLSNPRLVPAIDARQEYLKK